MLKFTLEKKTIAPQAALLSAVAGVKSPGAPVIEQCGLMIAANAITISAVNEANAIVIENIPITIESGNFGDYADRTTKVNIKKLVSIIKSAKDKIQVLLEDNRVTLKTGKATYALEACRSDRSTMPVIRLSNKNIKLKTLTDIFKKAHLLTQNTEVVTTLSGCLISGNELFCTDRVSAMYMKNTGIWEAMPENVKKDLLLSPDLFATCLSKFDDEEGTIGITESGTRLIIKVGNTYLGKTVMSGNYDKEKILNVYKRIKSVNEDNGVFATVDLQDFVDKMKEYQSIVEMDKHAISICRNNTLKIHSRNSKVGVGDSEVIVELENLKMPAQVGDSFGGDFLARGILTAGEILGEGEQTKFDMLMNIVTVQKVLCPSLMAFDTPNILYFTVPRSEKSA